MTRPERRSIEVSGHAHGSLPIPAASRVGPFIATGGVRGVDRATGEMPDDGASQIANMFANLAAIISAGGGSEETILKITIFVKTPEMRRLINPAWIDHYPDPARRPARHVVDNPALGGGMLVQCEALAVALEGSD